MTTVQKLFHSVFSPPRPIHRSKDRHSQNEDHYKNSTKPDPPALEAQRCQFTFSNGRQCRTQLANLSLHHYSKQQRDSGAAAAPDPAPLRLSTNLSTPPHTNLSLPHS